MSPLNPEQLKKVREKSRESIKFAALNLFARNGYHGTSVEEIAKQANVSKGLVYNYFQGKEQILEAVIFETFSEVMGNYDFLFTKMDPKEKLRNIFETFFTLITKDPEFWRLYWSVLFNPGIPEQICNKMNDSSEPIFSQLEKIFKELGYSNPKAECLVLHATLDGLSVRCKINEAPSSLEEIKQILIRRYLD